MSHPDAPTSLEQLNRFQLEQVLNEDPATHSLALLGTFPSTEDVRLRVQAIVRIEKTPLTAQDAGSLFATVNGMINKVSLEESTDIYTWLFGWLREHEQSDLKINVICPATDVHIRKYTKQHQFMVKETPELYEKVVKPYITDFPSARTQWLKNILLGISEQNKILFSSPEFLILPDMKWDLTTTSSLYLVALVRDEKIQSLRDLRRQHIGLLRKIHVEGQRIVREKWGLEEGSLRMYVHYQPSYYHFHVHIVNANYVGLMSMIVGQAHLLDDIVSLLEIDGEIFRKMTLTYGLGDQHGLLAAFRDGSSTEQD